MNDIRYRTEPRKYTFIQRFRIWWHGIHDAILEIPPTHYSEYIEVRKGEPGYDDAPWQFTTVSHPARFIIENGQCVPVNPETLSDETNPNWHNP